MRTKWDTLREDIDALELLSDRHRTRADDAEAELATVSNRLADASIEIARLTTENAALRAERETAGRPEGGTRDGGDLTFGMLRRANVARLPLFKNGRGEPAHSEADGSDWRLSGWCNAVTGELGELANLIKKIERGDFTLAERQGDVADELADVATYLDLLAFRCGVDLGEATASKWDRVSARVGLDLRIRNTPSAPPRDTVDQKEAR